MWLLSEDLLEFKAECSDWEVARMNGFISKAKSMEEEIEELKNQLRLNTMKFNVIQEMVREALDGIE